MAVISFPHHHETQKSTCNKPISERLAARFQHTQRPYTLLYVELFRVYDDPWNFVMLKYLTLLSIIIKWLWQGRFASPYQLWIQSDLVYPNNLVAIKMRSNCGNPDY